MRRIYQKKKEKKSGPIYIDDGILDAGTTTSRSYGVKGDGPHEQVANLGVDILLRLFKYHDVVRGEILEQITSRIVSRSDNAKDFLRLLENIIREYPDAVENYLTNVRWWYV